MKRVLIISAVLLLAVNIFGQGEQSAANKADFRLGNGLDIRLNSGDYGFNLGGFIQSSFLNQKQEGEKAENRFDIRHGFLSLGGYAKREKVSFLLQMDFTNPSLLLDAWIAYHPYEFLSVSVGQKQTFTNNREMTFLENNLAMLNRSSLSRVLSGTGREFGLFVETRFLLGQVGLFPSIAITSGDGMNSFGSSSIDVDYGELKYGGRLDICPLGIFSPNNDKMGADLAREATPKLKIGFAGSYNQGASNAIGEGHGNFVFYDEAGKQQYPDYRKIYADILFKYRGFSLLGEYANTSATSLNGLYAGNNGTRELLPGIISNYLYLGNSYNVQLGYVLRNGFALDIRYTKLLPEFKTETASLLKETEVYDATISKYFIDNRLKIQGGVAYANYPAIETDKSLQVELLFQVVF
jgi:hypothetical protein